MSVLVTALAFAAGAQAAPPATVPATAPADHSRHQQSGPEQKAEACPCCEHMAKGRKMACCEKHEKAGGGEHAGHSAE